MLLTSERSTVRSETRIGIFVLFVLLLGRGGHPAVSQLSLFPNPALVCAFGEMWEGAHPLCQVEADRLERAFDAAVQAGTYDEFGYTPADRRAVRLARPPQ